MTVQELITKLQEMPPDMQVWRVDFREGEMPVDEVSIQRVDISILDPLPSGEYGNLPKMADVVFLSS